MSTRPGRARVSELARPVALAAAGAEDLPREVKKRLGSTSTNRGLRALRWLFVLLSLGVFGFHIYWAHYAQETNEKFQELSYKDLRNRRLAESTLRGWILDRSGKLENALALYRLRLDRGRLQTSRLRGDQVAKARGEIGEDLR